MYIKSILVAFIVLFLCGCTLTPQEQVQSVKTCQSAGLDYEIQQNAIGQTIAVDCRKPKNTSNKIE